VSLPPPDSVLAAARRAGTRTRERGLASDGSVPNLVVHMDDPEPAVEHTEEVYSGKSATDFGLLAVALESDAVALHYPNPDLTAAGPWLVLEPLSGYISTIHTGTGRLSVALAYDRLSDHHLETIAERVNALLATARPNHDQYPVAEDAQGVFRTGMTELTPTAITITEDSVTASFDVSTTPATSDAVIATAFEDIDSVVNVEYQSVIGIERAAPSEHLRSAVEDAHHHVLDDVGYEWFPRPTVFSLIPGGEKIAFGTAARTADEFDAEAYTTGVELLTASLSNLGEHE